VARRNHADPAARFSFDEGERAVQNMALVLSGGAARPARPHDHSGTARVFALHARTQHWSRLFELLRHEQNSSNAIGFLLHLMQEMTMVEKAGQLEHSSLPFDPNDPATQQWIAAGGFGAMTIEVSVLCWRALRWWSSSWCMVRANRLHWH
jgi:hypothetical protein